MGLWLGTITLCVMAGILTVANLSAAAPGADPLASWGFPGFGTILGLTFGTVGFVVARRLPSNVIGWLFVAIGLVFSVEALFIEYTAAAILTFPGRLPAGHEIAWFLTWMWIPSVLLATNVLPLVFPTGHLPSRGWRPVVWLGVVATFVSSVVISVVPGPITQVAFVDNPLGIGGLDIASPVIGTLIFLPLLAAIGLGAAGLLNRFRAATGDARQQIKWLLLACSGVGAGLLLSGTEFMLTGRQTKPFQVVILIAALGIPVAAGLAILRYRLYEIDRLISRTVSYAVVTGLLAVVFAVVVVGVQSALSAVTQADTVAVTASTLVVAALFQPLRSRVKRAADRRFNRSRYDAERTVAAFAARLRDAADPGALRRELAAAIGGSVQPGTVGIWLRDIPGRSS